jgi:hypothetical protein
VTSGGGERRQAEHSLAEPRQRRRFPWSGAPRERRRSRWGEFRDAYPRIVTAMSFGLVLLLLLDVGLAVAAYRFARQRASAERSMTSLERERSDALMAGEQGRAALRLAMVAQQAVRDRGLNLSVAVESGTMDLQREGARLRTMKVAVGGESAPEGAGEGVRVVPPRGKRQLVRVVDGAYSWTVPRWVYQQRGLPVPAERRLAGALGPLALVLDDGTVVYSPPEHGPLADAAYVMPGAVRAERADLEAIRENLTPGLPVYFH